MLTKAIQFQFFVLPGHWENRQNPKREGKKMVKKLIVVAVFFVALCFAGVGCFMGGAYVGVDDGQYYDGPYRFGGGLYYYYNGGFYIHDGGAYHFHHYAPQDQRGYYEERYREHHKQDNRDYPHMQNQHPGHPGHSPRQEEWSK